LVHRIGKILIFPETYTDYQSILVSWSSTNK
jgi:hypothetical protein